MELLSPRQETATTTTTDRPRGGETADLDAVLRALSARTFRPHRRFASGHGQTIVGYLWPRRRALADAAAGDEARLFEVEPNVRVLVRCRWQPRPQSAPTLLLVHGLEGSSESAYMLGTADKAHRAGFNALRLNIRTCGGTQHLAPTLYHSGLSEDLGVVIEELIARDELKQIYLAGFSLGGNQSLKLAGELGADAPAALRGVAAVSPSIDLAACADAIGRRDNWIYNRQFLRALKRRMRVAQQLYPERYGAAAVTERVRTIREFDETFTAPHCGFRDAVDYYERASALRFVARVRVPTLVVHADDDPFVPFDAFRDPALAENPNVLLLAPRGGGHVGFVADAPGGDVDRFWAENRVVEFCRLLRG